MMTIRQVREAVAGLIHQMPDSPETPPTDHERFFGSDPTLEGTIAAVLAESLAHLEDWPSRLTPEVTFHMKLRMMFAAECLRQMEEAQPELVMEGPLIPILLHHAMMEQWPLEGRKWMMATFGPRRQPR